jgi:hypothetical protein
MNTSTVFLRLHKRTPLFPALPRHLAFVLLATLLLPSPDALAQRNTGPAPGLSDTDKAKALDKHLYEKDTDVAYKKALQRIPEAKKTDPWGGVREEPKK